MLLILCSQASCAKSPESIPFTRGTDAGYYLGAMMTEDSYRIGLFVYTVSEGSVSRRRAGLRQWVKRFINPLWGEFDAALVVYKDEDSSDWRLSFVCDIKGEKTDPKRYTYLLGSAQGSSIRQWGASSSYRRQGLRSLLFARLSL